MTVFRHDISALQSLISDLDGSMYEMAKVVHDMVESYQRERWRRWAIIRHERKLGRAARRRLSKAGYTAPYTPLTYALAIHPPVPGSLLSQVLRPRQQQVNT